MIPPMKGPASAFRDRVFTDAINAGFTDVEAGAQADVAMAAFSEAVAGFRRHFAAVMSSPEARGREKTAAQLAVQDMSFDAVIGILRTIPVSASTGASSAALSEEDQFRLGAERAREALGHAPPAANADFQRGAEIARRATRN